VQLDAAPRIVVGRRQAQASHAARHAQLLVELAREAGLERFAGLDLAAGKLPQPLEVRALHPARHEEAAVALDDGGGDDDGHARDAPAPAATSGGTATVAAIGGSAAIVKLTPASA